MYLSYINPNREFNVGFHAYRTSLDQIFDNLIYSTGRHLDFDEDEDNFTLVLELPGYKQSDVDVSLEKDILSVKAKRGERSYEQSVTLSEGVDPDKVEAKLEDGLLTISLGKLAVAKPRKIEIK